MKNNDHGNADGRIDEEWLMGYSAAINDAVAIVDSFGGPSFHSFSAPVLVRLKTRLVELSGDKARDVA